MKLTPSFSLYDIRPVGRRMRRPSPGQWKMEIGMARRRRRIRQVTNKQHIFTTTTTTTKAISYFVIIPLGLRDKSKHRVPKIKYKK